MYELEYHKEAKRSLRFMMAKIVVPHYIPGIQSFDVQAD
jgi:hypothetical protein